MAQIIRDEIDFGDGTKLRYDRGDGTLSFIVQDTTIATWSAASLPVALAAALTASAAELNLLDDAAGSIDIALAASATPDGMDITITVLDAAGVAIDAVHSLEVWVSEDAQGEGLTADTASGDLTWSTGTELQEIVSKKHYTVLTDANGVAVATLVDSANPTDQYIAVRHPLTGKVIVSAASGTNWEGAA